MEEIKQITFTHKEIAECLMEKAGIKEGHWGIFLEFGINGANIEIAPGNMAPAAIIPVLKIGIQRFESPNPLTVDAANQKVSERNVPESPKKGRRIVLSDKEETFGSE